MSSSLAHHKIAAAAETCKAKRLMAFSLGDTRVIVTCNHDVAREILSSSVFADRPVKESAYSLMFNRAIGFAPYGVYWRTLRRIAATHLFCPKQIKGSEEQRRLIASKMVTLFANHHGRSFHVRDVLKRASLNNMTASIFGRKYKLDCADNEVEELRALSNHIPTQGSNKRDARDFVDVLLSLQGADKLSDSDMIAVLWEMIFRGIDTVAVLIEWILARIVLHPDVQSMVHDELDDVVGRSRAVDESDVMNLIYLAAVIKEVLRLHSPGPLLSWARLAITDTTVDGYHVPKGTTAMVNMWAISRDPQEWADPLEFIPDRFVAKQGEMEFSVLGSDLRLAPFGSGRRSCPGKNLGLTTVTFWVATLLHEFEWLPSDQNAVDLSEVLKLSCEMANPLSVKVHPRRTLSSSY
ncbi:Cytochrome P450 78A9 [Hibiscus syriacus]|uniref:Cytochrome P450 78A9 n=1 Tax=Hibiscus syriacus TaxID=106335 RepID=A0A6A3AHP7_HIBSY|nr:Cytochrome P450 78A9 [Hibiscus syriacus]